MGILTFLQTESQQPHPYAPWIQLILIFVVFYLIFYFIVIRPQSKKEKERKKMLEGLKKNDYVLTSGGIYAYVQSIKDNKVVLRADEEGKIKLTVARSAIISVESPATTKEEEKENKEENV